MPIFKHTYIVYFSKVADHLSTILISLTLNLTSLEIASTFLIGSSLSVIESSPVDTVLLSTSLWTVGNHYT